MILKEETEQKIFELINKGWEFALHYGNQTDDTDCPVSEPCWAAAFTRKMTNGLWDNHTGGYSKDVNDAITIAYDNIIKHNRLK